MNQSFSMNPGGDMQYSPHFKKEGGVAWDGSTVCSNSPHWQVAVLGLSTHLSASNASLLDMPSRQSVGNFASITNALKETQLCQSDISSCVLLFFQRSPITDEQSGVMVTISCLLNRVAQSLGQWREEQLQSQGMFPEHGSRSQKPAERKLLQRPLRPGSEGAISRSNSCLFQTFLKLWSLPKYEKLYKAVRNSLLFL